MHYKALVIGDPIESLDYHKNIYDYYVEGGRWANELITKDGREVTTCQIKDIDFDKTDLSCSIIVDYLSNLYEVDDHFPKEWENLIQKYIRDEHPEEYITIIDIHN